MQDTSRGEPPAPAPAPAPASAPAPGPAPTSAPSAPASEPRGCLFALSQPPLMIFLGVIGCLLLIAAMYDLYLL
ncbi:hypothetical protein [Streptomyces apocyni]|uniref:hypothetical protein n=1 Tax=Streptomyces apocyni TaxID=2654677 RepID=UPI0012EA7105|nr:hypothetical protein [Streptomyces apocyni]